MNNIIFIDIQEAKETLEFLQKEFKSQSNIRIRDNKLFESAILSTQNAYYNGLAEFAASYLRSIVKNHSLIDGNKRFALIITLRFLRKNHHKLKNFSQHEWSQYLEEYVARNHSHDELVAKLRASIGKI